MRKVTVQHRDERGKVEYVVYESVQELEKVLAPALPVITDSLATASAGNYVISANGWVVPLLAVATLQDKYLRGTEKRPRKNPIRYRVFNFPKDRKVFREDKLPQVIFNYTPQSYNGIASTEKQCRLYQLSPRKMLWVQLIRQGMDVIEATKKAYPNERNPDKHSKQLIANPKLIEMICAGHETLQGELEKRGIGTEFLAGEIDRVLHDPSASSGMKIWAMKAILSAFEPCGEE